MIKWFDFGLLVGQNTQSEYANLGFVKPLILYRKNRQSRKESADKTLITRITNNQNSSLISMTLSIYFPACPGIKKKQSVIEIMTEYFLYFSTPSREIQKTQLFHLLVQRDHI